ncbi:MAG: HDOD domain-containing protein [Terracidiphilus sp.]|jgi:HD-like signal output (HDOD) protein
MTRIIRARSPEDGREEPKTAHTEKPGGKVANLPWAHLRLPPFPQVAVRVLQLVSKENVQLHQLSELISSDPAFASEVLNVANSLLYAPRYPASSILQAIAVLGANTLEGVCITVGVRAYLGKSMNHPAMRRLWHHNLASAIIAQRLASGGFIDKDLAYTCGILHDIGRIALAVIQPKDYAALLETHQGSALSILEGERELFGCDHCEAGQRLVASWKLPADFDAAAFDHHSARQADGAWGLAELVKVSCKMADAAGFAAFAGCETVPYPELLEQLPQRERRLFYPDLERLAFEVAAGIHAVESV